MSLDPARMLRNAMRRPFADHVGVPSYDRFRVRSTCLEPSARIKKMSKFPVRWLSKTILRPFGELRTAVLRGGKRETADVRAVHAHPKDVRVARPGGHERQMAATGSPRGEAVPRRRARDPPEVRAVPVHQPQLPAARPVARESDAGRVSAHRGDRRPDRSEDGDERNNDTSTDRHGYSSNLSRLSGSARYSSRA